jgi:hypothetical protein
MAQYALWVPSKPLESPQQFTSNVVYRGALVLVIGKREQVSFELGDRPQDGLLKFEIWCAGLHVTYFDNHVHIPSFMYSMQRELERLQADHPRNKQPFLLFGPTTDDVVSWIEIKDAMAQIDINLANGMRGKLKISLEELLSLYTRAIAQLEAAVQLRDE